MNKLFNLSISIFTALLFIGCGGGGGTNYESYVSGWYGETKPLKLWSLSNARFKIDTDCNTKDTSFVSGLSYKYTKSDGTNYINKTDFQGKLLYEFGYEVTFSIGDLVLGNASIENGYLINQHTEKEVTAANFSNNSTVIKNITAFLYSIDDDNNYRNGIQITDKMESNIPTGQTIDWSSPYFNTNIIELIEIITEDSAFGTRSVLYDDEIVLNKALSKDDPVMFFSVDWHDSNYEGTSVNFKKITIDDNHLILQDGSWNTVFDGYVENGIYSGTWSAIYGDKKDSGQFKYVIPTTLVTVDKTEVDSDNDKEKMCIESDYINSGYSENAIISPNSDDTWTYNTDETITWDINKIATNSIDIYVIHDHHGRTLDYYTCNLDNLLSVRKWYRFAKNIPNIGSYTVNPKELDGDGNGYYILVTSSTGENWDLSNSGIILNP